MKKQLYTVHDRLTDQHELAFMCVNDEDAQRAFNNYCKMHPVTCDDLELFYVGSFETEDGILEPCRPFFKAAYKKREEVSVNE